MTVVGIILLALGAMLTVLVPVWALLTLGERRERRRHARLTLSRCADIDQPANRLYAVEGRIRPGPAGPLTAPLSGEPCVWYFTQVLERLAGDGGSTSIVWETGGGMSFAVQDESGTVLVDSQLIHPDGRTSRLYHGPPVARTVDEDVGSAKNSAHLRALIARGILTERQLKRGWLSSSIGWTAREYVLPANGPVHVQGRPVLRDGRVMIGNWKNKYVVTSSSYAQLAERIPAAVRTGTGCLLLSALAGPVLLVAGYLLIA